MTFILLIRPAAQSTAFECALVRGGVAQVDICIAPVMHIIPLPASPAPAYETAIFTSIYGVENAKVPPTKALCVGPSVCAAAQKAGFIVAHTAPTVAALFLALTPPHRFGTLHYFRGAHVSMDLTAKLAAQGADIQETILYDQVQMPLSRQARHQLGQRRAIVPLFSARSAEFLAQEGINWQTHKAVAISDTVAQNASNMGFGAIHTVATPNAQHMQQAITRAYGIAGA